MSLIDFSPDSPCRCGFDGSGTHLCHAGRASGDQCQNEAKPRFIAQLAALAGMQMKTSVALACYCDACHAEAFPS